MKKAKLAISFDKRIENLVVKMAGTLATVSRIDTGEKWAIEFSGVKADTYPVEVIADGRIVSLPDITLLPALGGGGGDLP